MDGNTVNYSEKPNNEIETESSNFLRLTRLDADKIVFILISGFNDDNTIEGSKNTPWYNGRRSLRRLTTYRSLSVLLRILGVFRCRTSTRSLA